MKILRLILFLLFFVSSSWAADLAVSLPETHSITSILVIQGADKKEEINIQDLNVINRVLDLISKNNHNWSKPWHTLPTPRASAQLRDTQGDTKLVLWFGVDWLGARATTEGGPQNLLWHPKPDIEFEIRRILKIDK